MFEKLGEEAGTREPALHFRATGDVPNAVEIAGRKIEAWLRSYNVTNALAAGIVQMQTSPITS